MRIGSLCAGYGGLDMGVQAVLGGEVAWVSDGTDGSVGATRPGAALATQEGAGATSSQARGDSRKPDTSPERNSVMDRRGTGAGAVDCATGEGVERSRAGRCAESDQPPTDCEACGRSLGDRPSRSVFRSWMGTVLADLAELGYDAQWHGLRAADVGAPHGRWRVFIVAYPRVGQPPRPAVNGHGLRLAAERGVRALLPTPAVNDMGEGKTPDAWDEWTAKMQAAHGNGNGHGKSLAIEAQRLLPTPTSRDWKDGSQVDTVETNGLLGRTVWPRNDDRWGDYAPAIARWEVVVLGRPAPAPTEPGPKGSPRLSPAFVEWMMGLPAGHVTDVPGLTRNAQLKALGNGVVPQQAAAALRLMLDHLAATTREAS